MLDIGQYILGAIVFIVSAYIITVIKSFLIKFFQEKSKEFPLKLVKQFGTR